MTPDLIAGRYRVVRPVGRGGMGTVWLCRDEVLGREVAVKQVGSMPGESAPDAARALREARNSAALNHRNVVSVFDIVDGEDGHVWLVMEYVPSRTLSAIIREDGPVSPRRAAVIGAQVAAGLAAAHAAGTIHRDVKPGNILVSDGDVAKISDFGIARGAGDDQLTRTGLVTGTPSYFSPELARGEDPAAPSDVYALGATMYAAVEGRAPYPEQRNAIAMLQQIAAQEPPPADNAGELATPIARMMDRDPHSRWAMADAAHALRRIADRAASEDSGSTAALGPAGAAAAAGAAGGAAGAGADPAAADEGAEQAPAAGQGDQASGPPPSDRGGAASSPPRDASPSRGRKVLPLVVAAVLLLAMLGAGYALMSGEESTEQPEAAESPSPSPTQTPSPSRTESSSPPSSPTPTPEPETSAPAPEPEEEREQPTGQALEQTVQDYFAAMPGDTDTGWQMLAPSMKEQGRGSYESFWSDVESVELNSSQATGQDQVVIDLTYRFDDGSAKRERQRLTMQERGGDYLIADDVVLSSRNVS